MNRHVALLVEQPPAVKLADVFSSARAGGIALEGLVAVFPEGPFFIFRGPVAGQAAGGLLMGVVVGL